MQLGSTLSKNALQEKSHLPRYSFGRTKVTVVVFFVARAHTAWAEISCCFYGTPPTQPLWSDVVCVARNISVLAGNISCLSKTRQKGGQDSNTNGACRKQKQKTWMAGRRREPLCICGMSHCSYPPIPIIPFLICLFFLVLPLLYFFVEGDNQSQLLNLQNQGTN